MTLIYEIVLVTRNARDKVQVAIASLKQDGNSFLISRRTGQYGGKMTSQPELLINRGKAKRTVLQQATLEFNSIINKYLDKGYKKFELLSKKKFENITSSELDELVPSLKTDQEGNLKPMLAKSFDKCQNSIFEKPLFNSRKLNGVRCMIKYSPEIDSCITISRGGKNYNIAARHIINELTPYLRNHPELVLDGELYIHGQYLQVISGLARLETWSPKCEQLEYWIYDLAIPNMVFTNRLNELTSIEIEFNDSKKIKVLEHVLTNSWLEIQKLHDAWVSEGFEGVVARKPDKEYQFGKRGSDMIKVKMYQDDEFLIVDYSKKLREEDFCFICQTEDGKLFEAKPVGTREHKAEYLENIDEIIGKKGTIKYFEMSKEGIPLQPVFQSVRYDLD